MSFSNRGNTVARKKSIIYYISDKIDKMPDKYYGLLLMSPVLIVFLAVACYPLIKTIWMSMFINRPSEPWLGQKFIGAANYIQFFQDPILWKSIYNTLYFTVVSVFFELVIGLLVAVLINREFFGRGFVRACIMMPWIIPTVIAANAFVFMYHDTFGVLNDIMVKAGIINDYVAWLSSVDTAMNSIIVADVWKCFSFMTLIILAGLQSIPHELYESAVIDGANEVQAFVRITLPLLKNTIFVALLFRTIDALRVFDMVMVLTEGGPADSTMVLMTNVYRYTFRYMSLDKGAAVSVLSFLIILVFALIYICVLSRQNEVE